MEWGVPLHHTHIHHFHKGPLPSNNVLSYVPESHSTLDKDEPSALDRVEEAAKRAYPPVVKYSRSNASASHAGIRSCFAQEGSSRGD